MDDLKIIHSNTTLTVDNTEEIKIQIKNLLQKIDRKNKRSVKKNTNSKSSRIKIKVCIPKRSIEVADIQFIFIPGGEFQMGCNEGYPQERPKHEVSVSPFFLGSTTITNSQYQVFIDGTSYITRAELAGCGLCLDEGGNPICRSADWKHPKGPNSDLIEKEDHPVVQISWFDALKYCSWLSDLTGLKIFLPTEAQWEYAAKCTKDLKWPFGNNYSLKHANLEGTSTSSVFKYLSNEFGLFDMGGNVYEWCSDCFSRDWIAAGHDLQNNETIDPLGQQSGSLRVLRGGSWFDNEVHSRCSHRMGGEPKSCAENWGFRCCIAITDQLLKKLCKNHRWGLKKEKMLF